MPETFQCPACGGMIEYTTSNQDMTCPFCGTAVTTPAQTTVATVPETKYDSSSAETMVQHSKFKNSAEILDEVKRLLREDNKEQAIKVYRKEFGVPLADARTSVEQIEIDMRPSGKEEIPPPPPQDIPTPTWTAPNESAIKGDVVFDTPQQKSSTPTGWLIGCGIALVILCCLCTIVSVAMGFVGM